MGDSASMNVWLHKQVMTKLAANGGKVPDDLKGLISRHARQQRATHGRLLVF